MTTDHLRSELLTALRAAIHADPLDMTAQLALADWLEEYGIDEFDEMEAEEQRIVAALPAPVVTRMTDGSMATIPKVAYVFQYQGELPTGGGWHSQTFTEGVGWHMSPPDRRSEKEKVAVLLCCRALGIDTE